MKFITLGRHFINLASIAFVTRPNDQELWIYIIGHKTPLEFMMKDIDYAAFEEALAAES